MSLLVHRAGVLGGAEAGPPPAPAFGLARYSIPSVYNNVTGGGQSHRIVFSNQLQSDPNVSVDGAGLITFINTGTYLVNVRQLTTDGFSADDFRTYITIGGSSMGYINYLLNAISTGQPICVPFNVSAGATGEVIVYAGGGGAAYDLNQVANGWIELEIARIA